MAAGQLNKMMEQLRETVGLHEGTRSTDGELLSGFLANQDQSAFESLLRRHGPMVLGVCQRVLDNAHDAADAFQATWLVLVRRARTINPREAVGNWLYGVAYRTALEARRRSYRRRGKEKQVSDMPHPQTVPHDQDWQELRPLLDSELERLPEKYRLPVVLCDLEGRTRREVARQLNIPEGTLSNRLTSARKILAQRLSSRGVTLTSSVLVGLLANHATAASVPPSLLASVMNTAGVLATGKPLAAVAIPDEVSALTEGVIRIMFLSKLKCVSALVAFSFLLFGATAYLPSTAADDAKKPEVKDLPVAPEKTETAKPELKKEPTAEENVRERLKKHESEIAKIRAAMLKECDDEIKKLDELVKKADKDMAEAKNDVAARNAAFQARVKASNERMKVSILRSSIERDIRIGAPERKETVEERLGIHTSPVSTALAKQLALEKDNGAVITQLSKGSAAEKAGLKEYDIVLKIDGKAVTTGKDDYRKLFASLKTDTPVDFVVLRGGKQETVKGVRVPEHALKPEPTVKTPVKPIAKDKSVSKDKPTEK